MATALEKHTLELKELDSYYKAVDAYLNGITPVLNADVKARAAQSLKLVLLEEIHSRSTPLVQGLIKEVEARNAGV